MAKALRRKVWQVLWPIISWLEQSKKSNEPRGKSVGFESACKLIVCIEN